MKPNNFKIVLHVFASPQKKTKQLKMNFGETLVGSDYFSIVCAHLLVGTNSFSIVCLDFASLQKKSKQFVLIFFASKLLQQKIKTICFDFFCKLAKSRQTIEKEFGNLYVAQKLFCVILQRCKRRQNNFQIVLPSFATLQNCFA